MNDEPKSRFRAAIPAALFVGFFFIYMFSLLTRMESRDFNDYPFGADNPYYLQPFDHPPVYESSTQFKHVTTLFLIRRFAPTSEHWKHEFSAGTRAKMLFAFFGAGSAVIFYFISGFIARRRSVLFAVLCGLSGMVWYFGSTPECYGITVFFVSAYLLGSLAFKPPWGIFGVITMAVVMALGTLNEIIFPLVAVVPMFLAMKRVREWRVVLPFAVHLAIACLAVLFVFNGIISHMTNKHGDPIFEEKSRFPFEQTVGTIFSNYRDNDLKWVDKTYGQAVAEYHTPARFKMNALNVTLFAMCFPDKRQNYTDSIFPKYKGYFAPELTQYFKFPTTAGFLLLFAFMLFRSVRALLRENVWLLVALATYIFGRMLICFWINPVESQIYGSVLVLPQIILVTYHFLRSEKRADKIILAAFAFCVIASNLRFYLP